MARACISVRFAREVPCTISPLQTTKSHAQVIKIINAGRHKQRVMYAFIYSSDLEKKYVCVCMNEPTSRLAAATNKNPITSTMQYDHMRC